MKFSRAGNLFYAFIIICSIALLASCSKTGIKPKQNHSGSNTTGGNDTTIISDTLPTFYSPSGIALDAAGNIYVADYGNNLIRKISTGGVVSTFAGSGNQGSIDAAALLASFNEPVGLAADASGNLYVAEAGNNRVRKITSAGVVSTLAGSDSTGSANGVGVAAQFFRPSGVALDAGANVYVADAGNNLVRKITPDGTVTTFSGNDTTQAPAYSNPTGVTVDQAGNVFVANYLQNNIIRINNSGVASVFAGSGDQGSANGTGTAASFYFPNNVAADAAGNIYVSDGINNLIRKISAAGEVSTLAGNGTAGAADSVGTAASFNGPAGLAVDAAGNVYVADSGNNLIRKITPGGQVTTIAGTGKPGAKNGIALGERIRPALKSTLKSKLQFIYRKASGTLRTPGR